MANSNRSTAENALARVGQDQARVRRQEAAKAEDRAEAEKNAKFGGCRI